MAKIDKIGPADTGFACWTKNIHDGEIKKFNSSTLLYLRIILIQNEFQYHNNLKLKLTWPLGPIMKDWIGFGKSSSSIFSTTTNYSDENMKLAILTALTSYKVGIAT